MLNIYVISGGRPDFIPMQIASLAKNLKEDYDFTVFNNARFNHDRKDYKEIQAACAANGLRCIDVERDETEEFCQEQEDSCSIFTGSGVYSNPNVANAYPLCWAWKNVISKGGPALMMDSDMFIIRPVVLTEYFNNNDLVFIPQARQGVSEYMWNAFTLLDVPLLPEPETLNWYCGKVNGHRVDVSGQTYHYLQAHPKLKKERIRHWNIQQDFTTKFSPANYDILFDLERPIVLHYRSGSNWDHKSEEYHRLKTEWLKEKLNA